MKTYLPANKLYFRIGEIAAWLGEPLHTVRFWSDECGQLLGSNLGRSKSGQRIYTRVQAIGFATLQELLRVELYTIEGAKRQLRLAREREQAELSARTSTTPPAPP